MQKMQNRHDSVWREDEEHTIDEEKYWENKLMDDVVRLQEELRHLQREMTLAEKEGRQDQLQQFSQQFNEIVQEIQRDEYFTEEFAQELPHLLEKMKLLDVKKSERDPLIKTESKERERYIKVLLGDRYAFLKENMAERELQQAVKRCMDLQEFVYVADTSDEREMRLKELGETVAELFSEPFLKENMPKQDLQKVLEQYRNLQKRVDEAKTTDEYEVHTQKLREKAARIASKPALLKAILEENMEIGVNMKAMAEWQRFTEKKQGLDVQQAIDQFQGIQKSLSKAELSSTRSRLVAELREKSADILEEVALFKAVFLKDNAIGKEIHEFGASMMQERREREAQHAIGQFNDIMKSAEQTKDVDSKALLLEELEEKSARIVSNTSLLKNIYDRDKKMGDSISVEADHHQQAMKRKPEMGRHKIEFVMERG